MYTRISIHALFALIVGLVLAVGCTDANAAESTYLPLFDPCPFGVDGENDLLNEDLFPDGFDLDDLDDLELDDDLDSSDVFDIFGNQPYSQASPFMGSTPAATPASAPSRGDATPRSNASTIDINRANADKLTELPGIGPALAERIIEYRQTRQFTNVSQLQRVPGIGPATYERLRPMIHVE